MEEKKNVTVETTADEYSKTAVPSTARKSFLSVLIISLGYVFVVTSMQAGSVIGVSLSFNSMVWAVLVSSAILTVLSCIMGVIAAKSGLSFGLMARYSFGQVGTWVPVLIVAITTIGWFSIDAYLIGDSAHRLFSWMPTILICILAGIGMTITASKGTKWMNMLSNIAVPIVLIFGFISIIRAFNDVGGVARHQCSCQGRLHHLREGRCSGRRLLRCRLRYVHARHHALCQECKDLHHCYDHHDHDR